MNRSYFIFVLIFLAIYSSCNRKQNNSSDKKSTKAAKKISLNLKKPVTYCEKSFYCSYSNLVSDSAKKTLLKKRKAFLVSCEEALKQMPKELIVEYEKCVSQECGDSLKKCILNAGKKILLKDNEQRISPKKGNINNSTKNNQKPQKTKPKIPLQIKANQKLKQGTTYNGPTP